jgi:hypothetical protein
VAYAIATMRRLFAPLATLAIAAAPCAALAANITYPENTTLFVDGPGITLTILAGSEADSLVVNSTTFVVTVAGGDTFSLRYPGPTPGTLANNGAIDDCNLVGGNNDVDVVGPVTVTFTPNTTECTGGGGGGSIVTPTVSVVSPAGGTLTAGSTQNILWSSGGTGISKIRLALSVDGGLTFSQAIADNESNDGSFLWTLPTFSVAAARVRVQALSSSGAVIATDVSQNSFAIVGGTTTAPVVAPPTFVPAAATAAAVSIDNEKSLPVTATACAPGSLLKGSLSAVYYCGRDGKRYVFPNEKTYFTWFADFKGVQRIPDAQLAALVIGGNVTYRPGVRMVKLQSAPTVYVVDAHGTLRAVPSEAVARTLYGADWNTKVDDLSDAFFVNYQSGPALAG